MCHPAVFIAGILFLQIASAVGDAWQPLFNGKDLAGWDTEMMNLPDPAWDVPGL